MNILILGSGGREHTIAWKIKQSEKADKIFVAPGNAGTALMCTNIEVSPENFQDVKREVLENNIELVIVGPEAPLVLGIVDFFKSDESLKNISIIGPDKKGAMLEGSKAFSKEFMYKYNIPTAEYKSFTISEIEEAYKFLETLKAPYVLKADGLAAGKGVLIIDDINEAKTSLKEMLSGMFGDASKTVVIEEFLDGIEVSYFVLSDGSNYVLLPEAKDYKRIGEGDTGLNTGGMGAVSPVPFANESFTQKVKEQVIDPTINGLANEGIDYKGFIFFGLIKVDGEPKVIEYNVRMGDPETEVVIPRIKSDFLEILLKVSNKKLNEVKIEFIEETATTVMLVSGGYPENYEKDKEIKGLDLIDNQTVFHAGTKIKDNKILTSGGRVLALTSFGNSIEDALNKTFTIAEKINFDKKYYRKDIGFDLK
jgi:phosphoribosylamine--glycine ligase